MTETIQKKPLAAIVRDIPAGTKTLVISDAIPGQFRVSICPAESEQEHDLERAFVSRVDAIAWAAKVLVKRGSDFSAIVDKSKNRVIANIADGTNDDDDGGAS